MSRDNDGQFQLIAGLFIAGATLFFYSLKWFKKRRKIQDIPTSKIDSAAIGGVVEVQGNIIEHSCFNIRSPLSNNKCAFYYWVVLVEVGSGKNRRWKEVGRFYSHEYVIINDGGKYNASIALDAMKLDGKNIVSHSQTFRSNTKTLNEKVKSILEKQELAEFKDGFFFSSKYKINEYALIPGESIFVIGQTFEVKGEKIDKSEMRERFKEVYAELKKDKEKLKQFDKDGDGKISKDEMTNLKKYVHQTVLKEYEDSSYTKDLKKCTINFDLHKNNKKLFDSAEVYVSTDSQEEILKKLSRNAYLGFIFGPLMIGASIVLGFVMR